MLGMRSSTGVFLVKKNAKTTESSYGFLSKIGQLNLMRVCGGDSCSDAIFMPLPQKADLAADFRCVFILETIILMMMSNHLLELKST